MITIAWFKVDDGFYDSPKVKRIPRADRMACLGLWVSAGTWSAKQLTDGRVPYYMLEELGANVSQGDTLVTSGLWKRDGDDYVFHDWSDWQPTRHDTLASREKERRRKEGWRAKNRENTGQSPGGTSSRSDGASQDPDPTRPDPTHIEEPLGSSSGDEPKKKAMRLPSSWSPTAEHVKRAQDAGINLTREAEAFRLHAETHDRHAANWNAAFTTWLKKAKPSAGGNRKIATNDEWMYR